MTKWKKIGEICSQWSHRSLLRIVCAWGCGSKSTNWRSQNPASHINRSNQARFKGQINKKSWKHQKKSQRHKLFPFLFCKLIWSKHFDFQLPLATKSGTVDPHLAMNNCAFQRQKMARRPPGSSSRWPMPEFAPFNMLHHDKQWTNQLHQRAPVELSWCFSFSSHTLKRCPKRLSKRHNKQVLARWILSEQAVQDFRSHVISLFWPHLGFSMFLSSKSQFLPDYGTSVYRVYTSPKPPTCRAFTSNPSNPLPFAPQIHCHLSHFWHILTTHWFKGDISGCPKTSMRSNDPRNETHWWRSMEI